LAFAFKGRTKEFENAPQGREPRRAKKKRTRVWGGLSGRWRNKIPFSLEDVGRSEVLGWAKEPRKRSLRSLP